MITSGVRDFKNQDLFFPTNGLGRSISTHYIYEGGYKEKKHHGRYHEDIHHVKKWITIEISWSF
jgi:hypothetical protein